MSIESFIRAMPKVELYLQLEGAMQLDTLLMIAEQNEVSEDVRHFSEWVELLENPDYQRLDEITQIASEWLQQPDDLARVVYDTGVALSKQNVHYAEVSINPVLYMQAGHSFDAVMEAINDGRDRAERGWGVRMNWILTIPRDEPRRGDEIARWAGNVTTRRSGVVALGLTGSEATQPVGQFERAFRAAEKKGVPRVCQAGDALGAEGVLAVLNELNPDRLVDGWGTADAPDVIKLLVEGNVPLHISLARALCMGWVSTSAQYPLRSLYDEDIKLVIGTGMPELYKTTLSDEYLALVEHCGFSLEEVEELALNAVTGSFLPEEEKEAMIADFKEQYAQLRAEHIESEEPTGD